MLKIAMKLMQATRYSVQGVKALFQAEFAFRLEVAVIIVLSPVIYLLDVDLSLQLLLFALLWLLLIVEAVNSAIEATINRISLDEHPLSKQAKDMGSAAVFLTVILNIVVWVVVLFF